MRHSSRRRAEIERWLALREREGLTYAELSERCGLAPSTLSGWTWRLRRERSGSDGGFTELEVVESVEGAPEPCSAKELRLRVAGVVVEVPHDFDAEHLGRVLHTLRARC